MTQPPFDDETAWNEILSAYLDGELSPADRIGIDSALIADSALRNHFDELRGAQKLLGEWRIEAPPIILRHSAPAVLSVRPPEMPAWRQFAGHMAAFFMAGLLIGVIATGVFHREQNIPSPFPSPIVAQYPALYTLASATQRPDAPTLAISAEQADRIMREVRAEELKNEITRGLEQKDYQRVRQAYETLKSEFSSSETWQKLRRNEWTMGIIEKSVDAERN
jgi:hypothetical protein